ncbi:hypothetical protein [Flavobacterium sp.]|uniref:hypothetical protein n=1 Tax=Flavobacterium sp. TaxID=239 RepID=UPI00286C6CD9|nr:hypothetical protein [Flavobacterium sp.]
MEELDLLKKDWNKPQNYPKISEQHIYGMLHKNSSSTVKWILIVSIFELSFGLIINFGMSFTKYDMDNTKYMKDFGIYSYYQIFMVFMYAVIVYFIARFYLMYRKVSTTDSTKLLMSSILKTRKTVQNYILFNLVTIAVVFIAVFAYSLKKQIIKVTLENGGNIANIPDSVYIVSILVAIVVTAIVLIAVWLFYKLLYGFLLKKLKKNYEELKKIDL